MWKCFAACFCRMCDASLLSVGPWSTSVWRLCLSSPTIDTEVSMPLIYSAHLVHFGITVPFPVPSLRPANRPAILFCEALFMLACWTYHICEVCFRPRVLLHTHRRGPLSSFAALSRAATGGVFKYCDSCCVALVAQLDRRWHLPAT